MKQLHLLVGMPGSGKTTWRDEFLKSHPSTFVYSTDDVVEGFAEDEGTTYDEVWPRLIGLATETADWHLQRMLIEGVDVVWDQTSLTAKSRAKKLSRFGGAYFSTVVYFPLPDDLDLWHARLASRPGKTIPTELRASMLRQLQVPTLDEGFDAVMVVDAFSVDTRSTQDRFAS